MLFYAYGSALLSEEEIFELDAHNKVAALVESHTQGKEHPNLHAAKNEISLLNGKLTNSMISYDIKALGTTPWAPIGLGKPMTLDIREVYTGKYPGDTIFRKPKSMLVTSAVKSMSIYEAKPYAINFLKKLVETKSRLERPSATEQGTPVIYYSPALTEQSLTVDLSIIFDEFPEHVFSEVGNAFKSAAGLPVFLSYGVYLLAAGEVARIAGKIGESLFDGKPAFETSIAINIFLPGTIPSVSGFMLVAPHNVDELDPTLRKDYSIKNGTLLDSKDKAYTGPVPYIIISVDGSSRPELESFSPTAATAAVMSRFYGVKDGESASITPLVDALKLYNDYGFRTELDKLDKRLSNLPAGEEKDKLLLKRAAIEKNILSDLLKP